jgi:phospholipid-binding lipoprotein MlaA
MMHCLSATRLPGKTLLIRPAIALLFVLFCLGSGGPLFGQEIGSVSVRTLKAADERSPVLMAGLTGNDTLIRYAEEKPPGEMTPEKPEAPDAKTTTGESSDEYGDVTPQELGITPKAGKTSDEYGDVVSEEAAGSEEVEVYDPIRPFNNAMYLFNDKVYYWVWKPVSTGYKYVVPEEVRGLVANFYENLKAPIRIVNNLLQGDIEHVGTELASLAINLTIGVGGLRNCAQDCFGIRRDYADFGQTLGKWGFGYGFYIVLPLLGPSDVRDGIGLLFDWPLRATSYVGDQFFNDYNVGLFIHERVNYTSLHLGEYEALQKASVDPYVAMRDIYIQYRTNLIRKK